MLFAFCFIVICGGALSSPTANQYMDTILHTTLQNIIKSERLDPTHLPDFTQDYVDKIFFKKVHGKAEYHDGTLSGFSQVIRNGECQGPTNVSGSTNINCVLSFNQLNTNYKSKVKYGVFPKVTVTAKGNTSNTIINVAISKPFNQAQAKVAQMNVLQIRRLDTQFSGLGPLNGQMKVLEEYYKDKVTESVKNTIIYRFQNALNSAVAQVPMPLR